MAAYIRLASRSQAKFQNNAIESHSGFRAQPHLHRARYPPVVYFNSRLTRVRMWIWHVLSQWPSQAFSKLETKLVCGCYTARQSVSGVDAFVDFWQKIRLYSVFRDQPFPVDNKTRWRSHVIGHLPWNRNWSFLVAPTTEDGAITTSNVSSVASMRACLFAHKKLLVMCARTGWPKRGRRWREQFNRCGNARRLRQLRQRRKAKRWKTRLKSTHQKRDPSNARMTGHPRSKTRRSEQNQPPRQRLRLTEADSAGRLSRPLDEEEDPFIQCLCGGKIQVRRPFQDQGIWTP